MPNIDELCDRIEWITSLQSLREAPDREGRAKALEQIVVTQARIAERAKTHVTASALLQQRLSLSGTELQVVWLLVAVAIDDRAKQMLMSQGGLDPALSLESIRRLIHGQRPSLVANQELGPSGTLRALGLIERSDGGGADVHESRQSWAVAGRVLAWLHGDTALDAALASCIRIADGGPPPDQLAVSPAALLGVREAMFAQRAIVVISGMPGLGRRTLLAAAAGEMGLAVLHVDCSKLAKDPAVLRAQLRQIARESRLLARVPLLAGLDSLAPEALELVGSALVAQLSGLVLATTGPDRLALRWDRPVIAIELAQPTSAQRAALWKEALGQGTAAEAEQLADQYPLAPSLIRVAAEAARVRAPAGRLRAEDIYAGIRAVLDDRLGQFAKRVTVTQTWDDLVLPQDQVDTIAELIARVRGRTLVYEQWGFAAKVGKGLGITALFSGPPGTGKTMAAALIARELGLELYQVDLAKLVSKWVGETEKQLAALFDAAEAGHAILLFDEADSLFGKRTDVRSSNDRYANLETNYLLQRLETFTGICLLTSNHEANLDPAFQRRLSLHLRFELPDADERQRLWAAMLPTAAPVDGDLALESLANRYVMSGGYIRNAVLRAAFLAADGATAITAAHLEAAARVEFEGMGNLTT